MFGPEGIPDNDQREFYVEIGLDQTRLKATQAVKRRNTVLERKIHTVGSSDTNRLSLIEHAQQCRN